MAVPEESRETSVINDLSGKVPKLPIIEHQGLTQRRSNFSAAKSNKENAASEATDHGVKSSLQATNSRSDITPKPRQSAIWKFVKPAHKSAARMFGYALTLGTEADWWEFSAVIYARLTRKERAALAYAALMALDEDDAYNTAHAALFGYVRAAA